MSFRVCAGIAVALHALTLSNASVAAEYLLRPGDVLEIDVAGIVGMKQRMPVSVDGTIRVPLIGAVEASGKTVEDVTTVIQTKLSSKTLRQTSTTGQEFQVFFEPSQVLVWISEYRPIYVSGDVARPGQQTFRPGMTVRQGVSLAGGYELIRAKGVDSVMVMADLRSELNAQWIDYVREQLRIQRINAELAGETSPPAFRVEGAPIAPEVMESLIRLEKERFLVNTTDYAKESTYLRAAVENTIGQSTTLAEQQTKEQEGLEADTQDLNRILALEKRGNTTSMRVTDARRNVLFSSTRYLQATSQLSNFRKELGEVNRRLEKLSDARKAELLKEYQEAVVRANTAYAKIKSAVEKLTYTSGGKAFSSGGIEAKPVITLIRDEGGDIVRISADEDAELKPGDVVEASLRSAESGASESAKQAH